MMLNEAIKKAIENWYIKWNSTKFAYINWISLVNQIGVNITTRKLKDKFGEEYKNKLTTYELSNLAKAEKLVVLFLNAGINLKQIKIIFYNTIKKWKKII